jgi:hypothetical protein
MEDGFEGLRSTPSLTKTKGKTLYRGVRQVCERACVCPRAFCSKTRFARAQTAVVHASVRDRQTDCCLSIASPGMHCPPLCMLAPDLRWRGRERAHAAAAAVGQVGGRDPRPDARRAPLAGHVRHRRGGSAGVRCRRHRLPRPLCKVQLPRGRLSQPGGRAPTCRRGGRWFGDGRGWAPLASCFGT